MAKKEIILNDDHDMSLMDLAMTLPALSKNKAYKKTCKVYNSKYRKEAEDLWDKTGNVSAVYRFLSDQGEKISRKAVERYFKQHYNLDQQAESVQSYFEDLGHYMKTSSHKEERLRILMAMNDKLMVELAASIGANDVMEMRKTADSIVKLQGATLNIQKQIDEYASEMRPVQILIDKFRDLITVQMKNVNSQEAKKVLVDLVESLQDEWEGIDE